MNLEPQTQQFINFLLTSNNPLENPNNFQNFLKEKTTEFQQQSTPPLIRNGKEGYGYRLQLTIVDGEHEYAEQLDFFCPKEVNSETYARALACTYLDGEDEDEDATIWTGKHFSYKSDTFEFDNSEYRLVKYDGHVQLTLSQSDPNHWIEFDLSRFEYYQSLNSDQYE